MACESGFSPPKLKTCYEQIDQIFEEREKGYQDKLNKLEEEKTVLYGLLDNRKNLEKENSEVKAENKVLQEEITHLRLTSNETRSKLLEIEKGFEALKKSSAKKQANYTRFLHTVQKKCTCKFKESMQKYDTNTPTFKIKNVSNVFFKSPVKGKFNHSAGSATLAPMTEDLNLNTPIGALKASTPMIVGETEKSPVMYYEIDSSETDSDDEWLNSPSLFTNNESREMFEMPKSPKHKLDQLDKKPLPIPVNDLILDKEKNKKAEVSAELFSDDSPSNKEHVAKLHGDVLLKQNNEEKCCKMPDVFVSNSNIDFCRYNDELLSTKKTDHVRKPSENDSFFEFSESIQKKSKIMKILPEANVGNASENPTINSEKSCDLVLKKGGKDDEHIDNNKNLDVKYKYSSVVRKKDDREKLNGYACEECRRYYQSDKLSEERLKEVLKHCSRHKHESSPPPSTPDDFWKIDFPPTQDCIDKGYMLDENQTLPDYAKPKWRKAKRKKNVMFE